MKSGKFNFLETSGPLQDLNGTAFNTCNIIVSNYISNCSVIIHKGRYNTTTVYHFNITTIFLSPLPIKIGLIKIFVKAMDKESEVFAYLRQHFSKISET